jgi:PKD repeat protein
MTSRQGIERWWRSRAWSRRAILLLAAVALAAPAGLAFAAHAKSGRCSGRGCATLTRADAPFAQGKSVILGARLLVRQGRSPRPLSGRTLAFYAGGRRVCSARTDRRGRARCEVRACPVVSALVAKGVTVRFTGAAGLRPSRARRSVSRRARPAGCQGGLQASFSVSPSAPLAGQSVTFSGYASGTGAAISSYRWSFGDGGRATGKTAHHSFAAGYFKVVLAVTAANGSSASTNRTIHVTGVAGPSVSFTFSPAAPVAGQAVAFDGSGSRPAGSPIASYRWSFGDGATGSGKATSHAFAPGTYAVTLTVTAANGGSGSSTRALIVSAANTLGFTTGVQLPPSASFTFSPGTPASGQAVSFDGSGSSVPGSSIASYQWDFGDGGSATGSSPSHAYSAAGSYTVTLTVTAANGLTGSTTRAVTVDDPPVASFAFSPGAPSAGQAVSFDGSGSTAPGSTLSSYQWDFGDGGSATGVNPAHAYSSAGSYTVTLTVTAANGLTGSSSEVISVGVPPIAPTASFTFSPPSPTAGQAVSFDASGSTSPGSSITSYQWDFGDGGTGSGAKPSHAFTTAASYTVTLTVTAANGLTGSTSHTVTVAPAPVAPTASFTFSPSSPTAGQSVSFDGSGSTAPGSSITSYDWNFGDGTTGSGVKPSHTFNTAAGYTVTLTVTAANGLTGSTSHTVTVAAVAPTASFTFSPSSPMIGQTVSFDASGSSAPGSSISSYQWNFGDGSTGTGVKPSHAYKTATSYTVTLTVTAANGLTGTTSKTITVVTPPRASFTYSQTNPTGASTLYFGYAVNFDGSGSTAPGSSISSYQWNFGDGTTGSGVRPSHTYTQVDGSSCPTTVNSCTYTVTLTVTAANGLTGSTSQTLTVFVLIG